MFSLLCSLQVSDNGSVVFDLGFLPGGSLCILLATGSNQLVLFKDEFGITS